VLDVGDGAGDFAGEALKNSPGFPTAHLMMGNVHMVSRRYEEAAVSFRKALALAPGFEAAAVQLSAALEGGNDFQNSALLLDEPGHRIIIHGMGKQATHREKKHPFSKSYFR